ncbi:MAG: XRE family transcriptional regulator [Clostridia bacterium]|nr:XRE family transcriptional regulator [Clostridia bacterium]
MLENKKLAANIKSYRKMNRMTQSELAEKIFVSCQAVSKWERGETVPELDKVCLLSDVFAVSVDELLGHNYDDNIYMVAIDGGGSKTEFMLFDKLGKVYEKLTLGGCNPNAVGINTSFEIIREGIIKLNEERKHISAIYVGASGFKTSGNGMKIKKLLEKEFPAVKIACKTDIINVIAASGMKEKLIAAICGTGTVVYLSENEKLTQYTGWGYLFDKGGSGFHIGRDGITAALEEGDGFGEHSLIKSLIEEKLGTDVKAGLTDFYSKGQEYIASFASCVFKAFETGDKVADKILSKNASRVAEVINEVYINNSDVKKVILSGSIFTKDDIFFNLLKKYTEPQLELIRVKLPQVYGAALCCAKMCNLETETLYKKFTDTEA